VRKHPFGFWELDPKPSKEELAEFYKSQYFDSKNFERKYTEEEYFHKQVPYMEAEFVALEYGMKSGMRMLDVGCGEGFSLHYFAQKGWQVFGTDYSRDGVSRHFPELAEKVTTGDTEDLLAQFAKQGLQFDLIILNNVLEHLLNPLQSLQNLRAICSAQGAVRAQVPNDFSRLQLRAKKLGCIDRDFWVAPHEHMSYFERDSLIKCFQVSGFTKTEPLADYPIDFNLMNPDSNYIRSGDKGKNCHIERVRIENLLAEENSADLVAFRRGCGQAGVGRNIIVYGRP
jgi:2-polyprenyl-3-methyl-5-hydroxy-6-metoxy-1,4-benzoquinol methylase